jgi:hypothetical protein
MYALAGLVVALVFATSHVATAVDMAEIQRREAEDAKPEVRLSEAKSLDCTWTQGTDASWVRSRDTWGNYIRSRLGLRPSAEPVTTQTGDAPFSTQFDAIDWHTWTAQARFRESDRGTASLSTNMGSITFIEASLADFPGYNTVRVTTVFVRPMEPGANAYPAVMSQHVTIRMPVDVDAAEQYYGSCSVVVRDQQLPSASERKVESLLTYRKELAQFVHDFPLEERAGYVGPLQYPWHWLTQPLRRDARFAKFRDILADFPAINNLAHSICPSGAYTSTSFEDMLQLCRERVSSELFFSLSFRSLVTNYDMQEMNKQTRLMDKFRHLPFEDQERAVDEILKTGVPPPALLAD